MATVMKISPNPAGAGRRMQWGRAFKALRRLSRGEYGGDAIQEYAFALEGGDCERDFQRFLREPAAAGLLAEQPDLAASLDDFARLRAMPAGSLGRAYLELAERDGIRVVNLVEGFRRGADYTEMFPDPARRWFADRGTAAHDLDHVLMGYERDEPGELQLICFTLACRPRRVLRVSLLLSVLTVPKRVWLAFLGDLWRAWRRGRAARITRAVEWEKLLSLPIDEVRRRLGVAALEEVHPDGRWRVRSEDGRWERVPHEPAAGGREIGIFESAARSAT